MPTTINLLDDGPSLARFPANSSVEQTAQYLNDAGIALYKWNINNGTAVVVSDVVKIPSCNSLLITPGSSSSAVEISLDATSVPGTLLSGREFIEYIFHCLVLCSSAGVVSIRINSTFSTGTYKSTNLQADVFTACRSNTVTYDESRELPSSAYLGADDSISIDISIEGHNGSVIYMTFPCLVDANSWKFNYAVPQSSRYIPTMFRDIDLTQDPEYPFFRLIDALSYGIGDAMQIYSDWFRFEPDEMPPGVDDNSPSVRSQLTDPEVSPLESLLWSSNIVGRQPLRNIFAVDPTTSASRSWLRDAYPLDLASTVTVDLVAEDHLDISTGLVYFSGWSTPVRTATTSNVSLSSGLISGASFGGVTVQAGDRVLVKDQTTPSQNGIYVVVASGAASRATDADSSGEFTDGKTIQITEGIYANSYWRANISGTFTLGTSSLTFSENDNPGVIDGVNVQFGTTVLLTNQKNPAENGAYLVLEPSLSNNRIPLLDSVSDFTDGLYVYVEDGDTRSGTLWKPDTSRLVTLGSDPVFFNLAPAELTFVRDQISTAMYGHASGSGGAIRDACRKFLSGDKQVAIEPNTPSPFYITVRTIDTETMGLDSVDMWSQVDIATTESVTATDLVPRTYFNGVELPGSVVDGVAVELNSRVLVKDQITLSDNGIYDVPQRWGDVRAASTANVSNLLTDLLPGDSIDGVTLAGGDRVLLKNQTTGSQNGIYNVPIMWSDVRLATAAALPTCTYSNGTSGVGATLTASANGALSVDGIAVASNDRIIVKNQTSGLQNGIYTVTATGSASAPWVLTRATDADATSEFSRHKMAYVTAGATNSAEYWGNNNTSTITVGTTAITFLQYTSAQRATDADSTSEFAQHKLVYVTEGTTNGGDYWQQTTSGSITVGTTSITFALASTIGRASDADTAGEFTSGKSVRVIAGDLNGDTYFTIDTPPTILGTDDIEFIRSSTLGSSPVILASAEAARPLGFTLVHEAINRFSLTFDSPSLGRLGSGALA